MKTKAKGVNTRTPKISYLYRDYKVKLEDLQLASPAQPKIDLRKSRFSPNVWALALTFTINMGLSLREASFWMKAFFGIDVSHETLNTWMGALAHLLAPLLTISSEAKVLVGDETHIKIQGENGYFWVIYDPKKAQLIVSQVAFTKDTTQALCVMYQAFVHNQNVEVFVSDGNPAYQLAWNFLSTQGIPIPKHVIIKGLKAVPGDQDDATYRLYKNLIERFFRTFKQRYHRTHGFGSWEGAMAYCTLFALFFTFFRPHQLLDGKCPVEITTQTPFICEKWALLIQKAFDRTVPSP
jgi:transposase-like protein